MLVIKGHGKTTELCFNGGETAKEAREALINFEKENRGFLKTDNAKITYSGIKLKYNEEIELSKCVKKIFGEGALFVKQHRLTTEQIDYSLEENESTVMVLKKSLRSGESISSRGDVLIYGDVNPGSTVTAKGNITVLGALRGCARILESGRVFALKMQPTQIRIGNVYSYNKTADNVNAAYALEENGEIILQCL